MFFYLPPPRYQVFISPIKTKRPNLPIAIHRQLGHLLKDPPLSAPFSWRVWLYQENLICFENVAWSYQRGRFCQYGKSDCDNYLLLLACWVISFKGPRENRVLYLQLKCWIDRKSDPLRRKKSTIPNLGHSEVRHILPKLDSTNEDRKKKIWSSTRRFSRLGKRHIDNSYGVFQTKLLYDYLLKLREGRDQDHLCPCPLPFYFSFFKTNEVLESICPY